MNRQDKARARDLSNIMGPSRKVSCVGMVISSLNKLGPHSGVILCRLGLAWQPVMWSRGLRRGSAACTSVVAAPAAVGCMLSSNAVRYRKQECLCAELECERFK